eukprot:COSAG04_NODE_2255_length_4440_cov_25.402952_6_plen_78_part_00
MRYSTVCRHDLGRILPRVAAISLRTGVPAAGRLGRLQGRTHLVSHSSNQSEAFVANAKLPQWTLPYGFNIDIQAHCT